MRCWVQQSWIHIWTYSNSSHFVETSSSCLHNCSHRMGRMHQECCRSLCINIEKQRAFGWNIGMLRLLLEQSRYLQRQLMHSYILGWCCSFEHRQLCMKQRKLVDKFQQFVHLDIGMLDRFCIVLRYRKRLLGFQELECRHCLRKQQYR